MIKNRKLVSHKNAKLAMYFALKNCA